MFRLVLVVLIYGFSLPAMSAGFDCNKAQTDIEKRICANEQLSQLDSTLTDAYKQALNNTEDTADLRKQQRAWLSKVRAKCTEDACLSEVYQQRIAALQGVQMRLPRLSERRADPLVVKKINHTITDVETDLVCDTLPNASEVETYFDITAKVTLIQDNLYSFYATAGYYCGGPYPVNDYNVSMTFDLSSGDELSLAALLKDDDVSYQQFLQMIEQAYLDQEKNSSDDEYCDAMLYRVSGELGQSDFAFHLTERAMVVQPIWPHAIEACADPVTLPYSALQPLIKQEAAVLLAL